MRQAKCKGKHKVDVYMCELLKAECEEINQTFKEEFNKIRIPFARKPFSLKVLQISVPLLFTLNVFVLITTTINFLFSGLNGLENLCKILLLFLLLQAFNAEKEKQLIQLKFDLIREEWSERFEKKDDIT
ncbi:hypothetical protein JZO67_004190 [Enterococcus sp. 665A]|uniref:Uncharacterized protein n=2 Tax=Candidatus Enterococcus ferrettii TaxID=2815324 RepID=A0ABV0EU90_9ENTE|nr:hypothetical protein [Enterococcus sp. 665A]MBO1339495.1 hypothetical protein [Enterococcus sp. 665A]